MRYIIVIFFLLISFVTEASHNRAGEILYRHVSGLTYEITIYTYTNTESLADSPILDVNWGDNTVQSVGRSSITLFPEIDSQRNIYKAVHTYAGPGSFTISFSDRFRNGGVKNFPKSAEVAFYTETTIIINPFITSPIGGNNNSVQLLYPPLDEACVDEIYVHNPLAFDPDGDSLVFSIIPSRGLNGNVIPSYVFPNSIGAGTANNLTIDSQSGEMIWNEPKIKGEYNLAIRIEEYRQGILMGYVVRDMQINVRECTNRAPEFTNVQDTCIEAGTTLLLEVKASDPDNNALTLTAFGYPFEKTDNTASFNQTSTNPAAGNFQWNTTCDDVRNQRHQVLFRADDEMEPERLIALKTYNITVVGPAPKNPKVIAINTNLALSWEKTVCTNAIGYKLYRRIDSIAFFHDFCEIGVPEYTGYKLLTTIEDINDTTFLDQQINFGTKYCYLVTSYYPDGAESYASEEFCGFRSRLDAPVITKVSVGVTSTSTGEDTLSWIAPLQLDTINGFVGPFQYQVEAKSSVDNAFIPVFTSSSNASLSALNTSFNHKNINTQDLAYHYRVSVLSNGVHVGSSDSASSIFLTVEPTDNAINLSWFVETPWQNDTFFVYQQANGGSFQLLTATTDPSYVSTDLANGTTYCYYVLSKGRYLSSSVNETIWNTSQQACAIPLDNVIPCAVGLTIDGNCDLEQNLLTWDDATLSCAGTDDVLSYNIYFAPTNNQPLSIFLTNIVGSSNTNFTHIQENSIAGCYAITTIDSVGNESSLSNVVCIDNCPEFKLPNVFTPNGDGINDTFKPVSSKFIESISFTVFNRWGDVVFATNNPNIGWNGKHQKTGNIVSDGVYQYLVSVDKKTINGLINEKIQGYLTIKSSGGTAE